ncbi:hypothetical protein PG985_002441 [Apiospora marii]|uniref:uncharacterized protein n=1 Tax=Apiospora marii TaxID=335849 RepID=UPI00312F655E
MLLLDSAYPLKDIKESDLQRLCKLLWDWEICKACSQGRPCLGRGCAWQRSPKLERFFAFYKEVTSGYVPELLAGNPPALRSQNDLLNLIETIKHQPTTTRAELTTAYFNRRESASSPPLPADQHRAVNLAVKVVSMMSCSGSKRPSGGVLELGTLPILWPDGVCFADFIFSAFPGLGTDTSKASESRRIQPEVKFAITAARLKKIASLRFEPTDDLRNHLRLDSQNGVVEIYHHTSVLKEHIAANEKATEKGSSSPTSEMLAQVSREVLHSTQEVLFPFNSESEVILRSLMRKQSLDPDCVQYGFAIGGDDFAYSCFGSRLMDLYEEVDNPSPRGIMEKWFERKSGARYVMMATLVGVIIAVVLGILSLAVGLFQSWVAYEAWKHPVPTAE